MIFVLGSGFRIWGNGITLLHVTKELFPDPDVYRHINTYIHICIYIHIHT
jgi:hypothetical protein